MKKILRALRSIPNIVWKDVFKPRYMITVQLEAMPKSAFLFDQTISQAYNFVPCVTRVPSKRPLTMPFNLFYNFHSSGNYTSKMCFATTRIGLYLIYGIGSTNRNNVKNASYTVIPDDWKWGSDEGNSTMLSLKYSETDDNRVLFYNDERYIGARYEKGMAKIISAGEVTDEMLEGIQPSVMIVGDFSDYFFNKASKTCVEVLENESIPYFGLLNLINRLCWKVYNEK